MTTLEDLLALFPDNTTGDISAEDLRSAVTGLWTEATKVRSAFSYQWALADPTPGGGHFSLDQGWDTGSVVLYINKTTKDGEVLPTPPMGLGSGCQIILTGPGAISLTAVMVADPVDSGAFYTVDVAVTAANGTPADNADVRVVFAWTAP